MITFIHMRVFVVRGFLFAALAIASATAAAAPPIVLPVEVLGPVGTTRSVTVDTVNATNTLSLRLHGATHAGMVAVKVDDRPWIALTNTTAKVAGLAGRVGGIGGPFTTLDLQVALAAPALPAGRHTVAFRFAVGDDITIGFRVLRLNLLDTSGQPAILASSFVNDNPATWSAPLAGAADRAAGETLWRGATLIDRPGGPAIRARCSDCHAQSGHDLAYFNFSNDSIIQRSVFHGLSTLQGQQIASYIRSLPGSHYGRPWNPPYQPGPELDTRPVSEWAAGAGIDAVLNEDADGFSALPFISARLRRAIAAPSQSAGSLANSNIIDVHSNLHSSGQGVFRHPAQSRPDLPIGSDKYQKNTAAGIEAYGTSMAVRPGIRALINSDGRVADIPAHELPIAFQLLDWNRWLPRVHPKDVPGFDFNASAMKQQYDLLRQRLSAPDGENYFYRNAGNIFGSYGNAFDPFYDYVGNGQNPVTFDQSNRIYSGRLLLATKMWEIMQEFELEGRGRHVYGVTAPERIWYSNRFIFDTSPFINKMPDTTSLIGDAVLARKNFYYLNNSWYELQLQLNAGRGGRSSGGHGVIDWGYMTSLMGDFYGVTGEPEPVRKAIFTLVSMQQHDSSFGPENAGDANPGDGWDIAGVASSLMDWRTDYWRRLPQPQSKALAQALIQVEIEKHARFTPTQWSRASGHDGANMPPPNYVLGTDQGEAFERNIAEKYRKSLVDVTNIHNIDEPVRNGMAAVGAMIWTNNDWSIYRSATASVAAPTQISAVAGTGSVQIVWGAVPNATSYNLYRAVSAGGPFVPLRLMMTETTAIDRGLDAGSAWFYRVSANRAGTEGASKSAVVSATPVTGLVARWAFDEIGDSSIIVDASGQGNHGELIGGAQRIAGRQGGALSVKGSNQFASVPLNLWRYTEKGNVTVTAWLRSSTLPSLYRRMSVLGGYYQYGIVGEDGKIGVKVGDAGSVYSTNSVIDGQWHHLAITRQSNNTIKIWVDGVLRGSGQTGAQDSRSRVHDLGRGAYLNGEDTTWMGDLDEIRIYDRILNEAEVRAVMADQSTAPNSMATVEALEPTWLFAAEAARLRLTSAVGVSAAHRYGGSALHGVAIRTSNRSQAISFGFAAAVALLSMLGLLLFFQPRLTIAKLAMTSLQRLFSAVLIRA